MSRILIIVDNVYDANTMSTFSKEALSCGMDFAKENDMSPLVLVLGSSSYELFSSVKAFGFSNIFFYSCSSYSQSLYLNVLYNFIKKEGDIKYIICGFSVYSSEYLPMLAARIENATLVNDVYAFSVAPFGTIVSRSCYTSKLNEELLLLKDGLIILQLRPRAFPIKELSSPSQKDISCTPVSVGSGINIVDNFTYILKEVKSRDISSSGDDDLLTAPIIVSGGRGLMDASNFVLLLELASCLGGVVGASRGVVDLGWQDHSKQIGQTGKIVSPLLYIACGISGAVQHIVGIKQSRYIIAINNDPNAPIFRHADLCIEGDVFDIVPKLIDMLKVT